MPSDDAVDVLLTRKNAFGSTGEPLAAALRERLPDHVVRLASTPREETELLPRARVLVGGTLDEDVLDRAERLRYLAYTRVGTGALPEASLRERGIAVSNASGVRSPAIAEDVLGHLLAFARDLPEAWDRTDRREWRYFHRGDLAGSTVTVVGLGSIGHEVVRRLAGFDVTTVGLRYTPEKGGPTDEVAGLGADALHDALARTDYLVIASPLTEETRGLVGADEFRSLPPEAVLVNVARGGIVDTDALLRALRTASIRGAALDVTDPQPLPADHPLWGFENVVITPHIAGGSERDAARLADVVAENVLAVERDGAAAELRNEIVPPG